MHFKTNCRLLVILAQSIFSLEKKCVLWRLGWYLSLTSMQRFKVKFSEVFSLIKQKPKTFGALSLGLKWYAVAMCTMLQIQCWPISNFWKCEERHRNLSRCFKQKSLNIENSRLRKQYQRKPIFIFRKPRNLGIPGDIPPIISAAFSTEVDDLLEHARSFWQSLFCCPAEKPPAEAQIPVAHCFTVKSDSSVSPHLYMSPREALYFLNPTCTCLEDTGKWSTWATSLCYTGIPIISTSVFTSRKMYTYNSIPGLLREVVSHFSSFSWNMCSILVSLVIQMIVFCYWKCLELKSMTCILSYWTWIDSHWPNKYVWVDRWMTGGKWAYLMMCQQSVCFKWSLKGPRMGIFPKCRRIKWKWWTDTAWSCVYWRSAWPGAVESFMALLPPPGPPGFHVRPA